MAKRIALLGSTGSIGRNALRVAAQQGYQVVALAAGRDIDTLEEQITRFKPGLVAVANEGAAEELRQRLEGLAGCPRIYAGSSAARDIAGEADADIVLNAIVGIAGLPSTLAALSSGTAVALANKESLVAGGHLVMEESRVKNAPLLPVDSEHSAIFQCLQDPFSAKTLKKIWLTASGGPFYGKKADELQRVGVQQALKHPNWSMGKKITIDSATLMNKGLELIEAMWLFDVAPCDIEIIVQRESIIHSMVQFCDNSVLAQLGLPDMRLPIQYALTWPNRLPLADVQAPDFHTLGQLSFGNADEETFRCLAACRKAAQKGGLAPCAANGANEEAVALFLAGKIGFLDIGRLVESCVDADSYAGTYTLEDVFACDAAARRYVHQHL